MPRKPNTEPNLRLIAARKTAGLTSCAKAGRALEHHAHTNMGPNWHSFRCSEERYRSWEQGRIPREYAWAALTTFFKMSAAELGLSPDEPYTSTSTTSSVNLLPDRVAPSREGPTKRREFVVTALGAACPAEPLPARVEMRHVDALTRAVADLRHQDQIEGSERLLPTANQLLQKGQNLLGNGAYTDKVSRHLHSAVARLAVLTGWLAHDADDMERARAYYGDAHLAATLARDDSTAVHALANLAFLCEGAHRPREAITYLRAANDMLGRWAPAPLRALLQAREATQWAVLGDLGQHARLAATAREEYEPDDVSAAPWVAFVDAGEIEAIIGAGLAASGYLPQARVALGRAVAGVSPDRPRNATSRALMLARTRLTEGDVTGAVHVASTVVDTLPQVHSARVKASLSQFTRTLGQHPGNPQARDLHQRLAATR